MFDCNNFEIYHFLPSRVFWNFHFTWRVKVCVIIVGPFSHIFVRGVCHAVVGGDIENFRKHMDSSESQEKSVNFTRSKGGLS